eukprot:789989-Pelagomonas_calceolata.AAC.3
MVLFGEPCCALGLRAYAFNQPNSPLVCPNPPAAPPSLQVDPRMRPECPGGHLLRAGGGVFWGVLQSKPREVLMIGNSLLLTFNEIEARQLGVNVGFKIQILVSFKFSLTATDARIQFCRGGQLRPEIACF